MHSSSSRARKEKEDTFNTALYNRFAVKDLRRRDGNQFIRKLSVIELRS